MNAEAGSVGYFFVSGSLLFRKPEQCALNLFMFLHSCHAVLFFYGVFDEKTDTSTDRLKRIYTENSIDHPAFRK